MPCKIWRRFLSLLGAVPASDILPPNLSAPSTPSAPSDYQEKPFGLNKQGHKREQRTQEVQPNTDKMIVARPVPDGQVERISQYPEPSQPTSNSNGGRKKHMHEHYQKVTVVYEVIGNEFHGDLKEGGAYGQDLDRIPDAIPRPMTSIQVPLDAWGRPHHVIGRVIGNSSAATIPRQATFNQRFMCNKAYGTSTMGQGTAVQADMQRQMLEDEPSIL